MGFFDRFVRPWNGSAARGRRPTAKPLACARRRPSSSAALTPPRRRGLRSMREVLGDELVDMDVNSPTEAKLAIKLAKLRKKELQAEKRELSAELADHRDHGANGLLAATRRSGWVGGQAGGSLGREYKPSAAPNGWTTPPQSTRSRMRSSKSTARYSPSTASFSSWSAWLRRGSRENPGSRRGSLCVLRPVRLEPSA